MSRANRGAANRGGTLAEKLDLAGLDGVSGGVSGNDAPEDWQCPAFGYMTLPQGSLDTAKSRFWTESCIPTWMGSV